VSELPQPTSPQDVPSLAGDTHQLDALPVLVGQARTVPAQPAPSAVPGERRSAGTVLPVVQAAAVAAGGFVAGAAVVGLVHRHQQRSSTLAKGTRAGRIGAPSRSRLGGRSRPPAAELVQIVGSRSLLVDVHLLGGPGDS
jgi:hypothetical protein